MKLALVNASTRVDSATLDAIAAAVGLQLAVHVAPAWGLMPPEIVAILGDAPVPTDHALLTIFDAADDPSSLGYHYETDSGQPAGKVFAAPVLDAGGGLLDGGSISVSLASVVSHEACELIGDVDCNEWCEGPARAEGSFYARELCDPVQGSIYPVTIPDGRQVMVSDFVLPSYFDPKASGVEFDFQGTLRAPFSIGGGGYLIVRAGAGSEQQVFGLLRPPSWRTPGARLARRIGR